MPHFSFHRSHYDPNQPRVSRGNPDGGEWTKGGGVAQGNDDEDAFVQPVFYRESGVAVGILPGLARVLGDGFRLLGWLSRLNGPDRQAYVEFKAHEFRAGGPGFLKITEYGVPTREEVDEICQNGLSKVQKLVDIAVKQAGPRKKDESAQSYGSRVHAELEFLIKNRLIKGIDTRNFRAEISFGTDDNSKGVGKITEVTRGKEDSIRIDVIQDLGRGTVCMYDLKTGLRGLSIPRATDFAKSVLQARNLKDPAKNKVKGGRARKSQVKVKTVIITEVRPSKK
jgi:hypothetical protein